MAHTHTLTHTNTCVYMYIHICIYIYVCVCLILYIYVYHAFFHRCPIEKRLGSYPIHLVVCWFLSPFFPLSHIVSPFFLGWCSADFVVCVCAHLVFVCFCCISWFFTLSCYPTPMFEGNMLYTAATNMVKVNHPGDLVVIVAVWCSTGDMQFRDLRGKFTVSNQG